MNLYQFVVLSLINKISGKRGRGTIVAFLRGGKRRSVFSLKNRNDAPDERYSGIMAKVPNEKILTIFDELLKDGLIEIVEDRIEQYWYPLVYSTDRGRDVLREKEQELLPELEKILNANKTLIEFQAGLSAKESDKNG